jgi:hypothetical protein
MSDEAMVQEHFLQVVTSSINTHNCHPHSSTFCDTFASAVCAVSNSTLEPGVMVQATKKSGYRGRPAAGIKKLFPWAANSDKVSCAMNPPAA